MRGCILASGTPAEPYVQDLGAGNEKYVEYVQPLSPEELGQWRKSGQCAPVFSILELDLENVEVKEQEEEDSGEEKASLREEAWGRIHHLTCGVPRELTKLRALAVIEQKKDEEGPNKKKQKVGEKSEEGKTQTPRFDKLLEDFRVVRTEFWEGRIRKHAGPGEACEDATMSVLDHIFLKLGANGHVPLDHKAMALGSFFKDCERNIRPLTSIASDVMYTLWMKRIQAGKNSEWKNAEHNALETLKQKGDVERGYALEKLLLRKMAELRQFDLHYCNVGDDKEEKPISKRVSVQRLQCYPATEPPKHWKLVPQHTLVFHPGHGAERVDLILYNSDTVYFLELCVGDYRSSKSSQKLVKAGTNVTEVQPEPHFGNHFPSDMCVCFSFALYM
jgi:hypothetical protein